MWYAISVLAGFVAGCVLTYLYQSKAIAAGKDVLAKAKAEKQKFEGIIKRVS